MLHPCVCPDAEGVYLDWIIVDDTECSGYRIRLANQSKLQRISKFIRAVQFVLYKGEGSSGVREGSGRGDATSS